MNNDNHGSGTGCVGGITVFDSAAPLSITQVVNPFDGSFRPQNSQLQLSGYNGQSVKGTYRLLAIDAANGNTGTITCFQLPVRYEPA